MKCEFELCVYNRNLKCTIKEPEINSQGACDSCLIIYIDKDYLEKEKKRRLKELKGISAEEQ